MNSGRRSGLPPSFHQAGNRYRVTTIFLVSNTPGA